MRSNTLLALQINNLRKACGWTIPDLAQGIGVSISTVNRWLSGLSTPYPGNLRALADAFSRELRYEVTISQLTGGEQSNPADGTK